MATHKKTQGKKFKQKVQQAVQNDIFTSIAIASVLLNVLFFVSIFVLTSTSTFDRQLYLSAQERYCNNIDGVRDRAKELGSEQAAQDEWQIDCVGKDFKPFYKEAVDKYRAELDR